MHYLLSFTRNTWYVVIVLLFYVSWASTAFAAQTPVISSPWTFVGSNGATEKYQPVPPMLLEGKDSLEIVFDLHGTCLSGGDASAIIFEQNGWKYISLANYGKRCFNGDQSVSIPLSDFPHLDITTSLTGSFHIRFWNSEPYTIDIKSISVNKKHVNQWSIQSVDAMKVTKDTICSPKDITYINKWLDKAVEIGATHVAISQPYDNPTCGDSLSYTKVWVAAIRAHGLKVWHRHMPLAWESIYNVSKKNDDYYFDMIASYIQNNPTLFAKGDIFTPIPEPQNGGIRGATYCAANICQFSSANDFNNWIKTAMLVSELAFQTSGYKNGDITIGYFGFDGFVTWGAGNPDGKGILTDATVKRMGNITIDHYADPVSSMSADLDAFRKKYPSTPLIIGEWGTTNASTSSAQVFQIQNAFDAFLSHNISGVNYWHLGGDSSKEALLDGNLTPTEGFFTVQKYFLP